MSECPDTEYQNIGLDDLFDLRNSRLVRAQINTVDGGTNTADITLLDPCPELSGVNLTAVEFFYHCEWSTGTVRDLRYGYKAFEELDFVYCLFTPASAKVPDDVPTFYIIGHIDIHSTIMCSQELRAVGSEMPEQLGEYIPGVGVYSPVVGWSEDYTPWERKMSGCATSSNFLDVYPNTIQSVRYQHKELVGGVETVTGYTAMTIVDGVHEYESGSNYTMTSNVIVERISEMYPVNEVLRIRFFYNELSSLKPVSAAMSSDLQSVYVVRTRMTGGVWETAYYVYTFNEETGLWPLSSQGVVPPPPSPYANYRLGYSIVDREGNIGGGWSNEIDEENQPLTGQLGGSWNLVTETWDGTQSDEAWIGKVANDQFNDFSIIKGNIAENSYTPSEYDVIFNVPAYWGWYGVFGQSIEYDVKKEDVSFDEMHFSSAATGWDEAWNNVRSLRVTHGGILFSYDVAKTIHTVSWNEVEETFSVNRFQMQYPAQLDVAVDAAVLPYGCDQTYSRSFTAIDEESNQAITGVLIALASAPDDKAWRIYRNGVEITQGVEQCLAKDPDGKPIDQLMGMYWRA